MCQIFTNPHGSSTEPNWKHWKVSVHRSRSRWTDHNNAIRVFSDLQPLLPCSLTACLRTALSNIKSFTPACIFMDAAAEESSPLILNPTWSDVSGFCWFLLSKHLPKLLFLVGRDNLLVISNLLIYFQLVCSSFPDLSFLLLLFYSSVHQQECPPSWPYWRILPVKHFLHVCGFIHFRNLSSTQYLTGKREGCSFPPSVAGLRL